MFRNFLASTLRNMARHRLFTAIIIGGLGVAFAAAILIALFVYDKFHSEAFVPDSGRIVLIGTEVKLKDHPAQRMPLTVPELAEIIRTEVAPGAAVVRRLEAPGSTVRNGDVRGSEVVNWVDPGFFEVFRIPFLAGDGASALMTPDSAIVTREVARKYFGTESAIGRAVVINETFQARITAVLENPPAGSTLTGQIYLSARSAQSPVVIVEAQRSQQSLDLAPGPGSLFTYVRLPAQIAPVELAKLLQATPRLRSAYPQFVDYLLFPVALNRLHLELPGGADTSMTLIVGISLVGLLILLVSGINFVNLMTARASDRAKEIGVRKVMGADRHHLMLQFIGESVVYVAIALLAGFALVEIVAPILSEYLFQSVDLTSYRWLAPQVAACAVLFALLAGFYPAVVLSSFRPEAVLKGGLVQTGGSGNIRRALVILQFAFLIAILISTIVMQRQIRFATRDVLNVDSRQVLMLDTPCTEAFAEEIRKLPGVEAQFCSSIAPLAQASFTTTNAGTHDGKNVTMSSLNVDFGFFDFYEVRPLAGRLLSVDFGSDVLAISGAADSTTGVVVNETGMRRLGYANPQAALGGVVSKLLPNERAGSIVGIVPDFVIGPVHEPIQPIAFYVDRASFARIAVQLSGAKLADTLAAIEKLWAAHGNGTQFRPYFLDQMFEWTYRDAILQWRAFSAMSLIALVTAGFGLLGLSIYNAESRTKEIGIRRVMGASRANIAVMLGGEILRPVLWANLVAWPVAFFAMRRWLAGFAYHVDLTMWFFIAGTFAALIIAAATVFLHTWGAARVSPANLLRYE
jgi:putative ABC transport system permease protein